MSNLPTIQQALDKTFNLIKEEVETLGFGNPEDEGKPVSERHRKLLGIYNSLCQKEIEIRKKLRLKVSKNCRYNLDWGKCKGKECEYLSCIYHPLNKGISDYRYYVKEIFSK